MSEVKTFKKFGWHKELAEGIEFFEDLNEQEIIKLFLIKNSKR